jgi:hypothetical protein
METLNHLPLSDLAYTSRIKLPKWNCRTTALASHSDITAAKIITKFRPELNQQSHLMIASYHLARSKKLFDIWNKVVNRAAQETFGRPWRIKDYKVSGIGSDDFAERHKRVLRHCIHRAYEHQDMSHAHTVLAKRKPKQRTTEGSSS